MKLAFITPAPSTPALTGVFFKCSRSNSHGQTYNAGPFNVISRRITPFRVGIIRANNVAKDIKKEFLSKNIFV